MLVQTVTAEHIAVTRKHMDGVLNSHARQHPVSGIRDESFDRADQPFTHIQNMRQCVLNRSTTRSAVHVIGLAIRRAVRGKMLTTDGHNLDRLSEPTAQHRFSHRRQCRITSQDIRHSHHETTLVDHFCQQVNSVSVPAERLFYQQMDADFSQACGNLQMSIRGRCDDCRCDSPGWLMNCIGMIRNRSLKVGETANSVAIGDRGSECVVDLNE